jgi:flagellar biogenesis protein FliO
VTLVRWIRLLALLTGSLVVSASCSAATEITPTAAVSSVSAGTSPLAHLPLQRDDPAATSGGLTLVLELALVGVLILIAAAVYKRRQRRTFVGGASLGLRTLQSVRLTQGATLHVVQWGGEDLLLACTAQSADLLSRRITASPNGQSSDGSTQ